MKLFVRAGAFCKSFGGKCIKGSIHCHNENFSNKVRFIIYQELLYIFYINYAGPVKYVKEFL